MTPLSTTRLLKFINLIAAINMVGYLLACLTPYIHPSTFFPLTFLALGFPILLFSITCWILLFFFINKKKAIIFFLIMLLGFKNIAANFAFHGSSKKSVTTAAKSFRIISWNVRGFVAQVNNKNIYGGSFAGIMNYIKNANADVVCMQDYQQNNVPNIINPMQYMQDSLGYKNVYFLVDIDLPINDGSYQYGTCIFSKFPILQTNNIKYNDDKYFNESIGFADILVNNKAVRIFNTHLKSMYTNILPTAKITDFKYQIEDTNLVFHSSKLEKLKRFDTTHIAQAFLIKKVMDSTKIPFVFCGDLNAVPSSYVYHTITKNLNDAFLQNNFGWGRTYTGSIPFLRIDVILMSKKLNAVKYNSPKLELSDHYPVLADILL